METIPDLSPETMRLLDIINTVTIAIFTIEYFARIYVADSKWDFVFSFFGIVDLLAILPFYIATSIDLR